jgi:hypothetical protein
MKYTLEILIDAPRSEVIRLFDSTDNLYKWQPELQDFEHLSGEPGQVGSKSRMFYNMDGREVEMIETITKRNFPEQFSSTYEANGVLNIQDNEFVEIGDQTKWISHSEFKFSGFFALIFPFMKKSFKKQSCLFQERFKKFAEEELAKETS